MKFKQKRKIPNKMVDPVSLVFAFLGIFIGIIALVFGVYSFSKIPDKKTEDISGGPINPTPVPINPTPVTPPITPLVPEPVPVPLNPSSNAFTAEQFTKLSKFANLINFVDKGMQINLEQPDHSLELTKGNLASTQITTGFISAYKNKLSDSQMKQLVEYTKDLNVSGISLAMNDSIVIRSPLMNYIQYAEKSGKLYELRFESNGQITQRNRNNDIIWRMGGNEGQIPSPGPAPTPAPPSPGPVNPPRPSPSPGPGPVSPVGPGPGPVSPTPSPVVPIAPSPIIFRLNTPKYY